jgi:hypothetical protein
VEILIEKDLFQRGYFWEYYLDLERQFADFLNYVPYLDGNQNVYSFKLANLILSIGAHIDSALKEMLKCREFSEQYSEIIKKIENKGATIIDYYPIAEKYCLSERKVEFKRLPEPEVILPFQDYVKNANETKTPLWWKVYNNVKHEFGLNFKEANLVNAKNALAGAFLINVVHKPAIKKLFSMRVAKPLRRTFDVEYEIGLLEERASFEGLEKILDDTIYPPLYVETPLFFFNYEQSEGEQ